MYYFRVSFLIRWDMLALKAYGDANRMTDIMDANQDLPLWNWLPIGAIVACPYIPDAATQPSDTLPAWKQ